MVLRLFCLTLALLVGGCRGGMAPPENVQITIAPGAGGDRVASASLRQLAGQMVQEFMRVNPRVNLHFRYVPEGELLRNVGERSSLGAGPDLLITRVPAAFNLASRGYTSPVALTPSQLDPLQLQFLPSFRQGEGYAALPFLVQPSLACYDRRHLPSSPASLEQLVALAREGQRVGLSLELNELFWTATGFGAQQPLLTLFDPQTAAAQRQLEPQARARVLAWLSWLYRSNVIPSLIFVEDGDQLVRRLEQGQLDWISCNATAIGRLRKALGPNLAVSVLPQGLDAKASRPLANLLVLSFGTDSTASQRRVAERFALFALNDFSQNNLMTRAVGNMPVNQNVIVPVKDAPELAAMQRSLKDSIVLSFQEGVRMRELADPLSQLLKENVYGERSPEQVLAAIEALAVRPLPGPVKLR
jgi:hypothetical protein